MATSTSPPVRRPGSRIHDGSQGAPSPPPLKAASPIPPEETWLDRIWNQLSGNEGAGLALSFVFHALLLAVLAIPVIRHLKNETGFTTVVQDTPGDDVVLDAPLDTHIPLPAMERVGGEEWQQKLFDPVSEQARVTPDLRLSDTTSAEGETSVAGEGNDVGGLRIADPETAIKAGNFSVWSWPIVGPRTLRGGITHGTPGDAPKVLQDYSIVIRVKMPPGKRTVNLSDFSGTVVGTDGYRQKIPDDAWYFKSNGELIRARTGRSLPVINGTVELLIRVPGAASAFVKDTIRVHSRTLNEEQTIELTFQARD